MSEDGDKPWNRTSRRSEDEPPTPDAIIRAARRRAQGPATALILVGLIDACLGLAAVVLGLTGQMNMQGVEAAIGVVNTAAGVAIVAGGLSFRRLDNVGLVRTASITAMIPCISLCLLLGLPVGVWALVTASSPDVKEAFREVRRKREEQEDE